MNVRHVTHMTMSQNVRHVTRMNMYVTRVNVRQVTHMNIYITHMNMCRETCHTLTCHTYEHVAQISVK